MIYEPRLTKTLEDALNEARELDNFRIDYDRISNREGNLVKNRDYANCLHQLLEIGARLNRDKKNYVVLGGLAILAHIYENNHEDIIDWRGTSDIDILAKESDLQKMLKEELGYKKINGNLWASHGCNGTSKPLATYVNDAMRHILVQLRDDVLIAGRDRTRYIYENSRKIKLYGIPINVPDINSLISMKREANRTKDREDIRALKDLKRAKVF